MPARHDENTQLIDHAHIEFMILFEIGQAPPFLHVDIRSKQRDKRERAVRMLAERVSRRFAGLSVYGPPPVKQGGI